MNASIHVSAASSLQQKYETAANTLAVAERVQLAREIGRSAGKAESFGFGNGSEILLSLLHDGALIVRQTLAEAAARNPHIPPSVAKALAMDEDLVAVPMLEACAALGVDDLCEIAALCGSNIKLAALARRDHLHHIVCSQLITLGDASVVCELLHNHTSDISEEGYAEIISRHPLVEDVQVGLSNRPALPVSALMRLVHFAKGRILEALVQRHAINHEVATALVENASCRATIGLSSGLTPSGLDAVVDALVLHEDIKPLFLVRVLAAGNFEFFCRCLASLTLTPPYYLMRTLKENPESLLIYWRRAKLTDTYCAVAYAALETLVATEVDCSKHDAASYRMILIQRMITRCDSLNLPITDELSDALFATYDTSRLSHHSQIH